MKKASSHIFLRTAFHTYQTNALIPNPSAQDLADKASRWFWNHLDSEDQQELILARKTAQENKTTQQEFDKVSKAIQEKLFE